eukprot:gene18868-20768_t
MGSSDESIELADVQKVLASKKLNVTYLKKVKFEKGSQKYLAISTNRVFFIHAKSPHKIEGSFHILEIQSIESLKECVVQVKLHQKQGSEKQIHHVMSHDQDQDSHFIIAHLAALLRYNFPGLYGDKTLKLSVEPADRLEKVKRLADALTSSTTDSEIGPCGGFSLSYSCICDSYGHTPIAEVMWDIDKIYGSHGCKYFSILDFDHLDVKEMIPVIATFEYNTWFKGFSCRSYKLSSELVDVLAKVLKSNASLEELDLYDCRLQKESIQKISQAIASNSKTAIKKLDIGKNAVEDRGTNALCTALASLPHGLESLTLKDISISAKGAPQICSALKGNQFMSSTLTCLNFSSNPLKSDGTSAICEFLANSNVVQDLDLSNADCAIELVFGALARGCLLHLKSLNLSGNPYSFRKAKDTQITPSVNKFFSSCMVLETINLSNTKISPEVVKAVLVGLIANTATKDVSLDLSRNDLRSAGAAEINSCLAGIKNLTSLDLADNGLDMDLVHLCQNIQKNASIKTLNLGQNIGKSKSINVPQILESIAEMMMYESLPLTSLSLTDCRLRQDAGIIIDSLGTNEALQNFDISGNFIGDEGARLLAKALQINTKLRNINIDRNGITLKGFNDISTALERNYSLQLISTPFNDISQIYKNNAEGVSTCFKKIEQLLLRNQSTDNSDQDHSLKLKKNLLLNSLDQESTDYLLVKVQDSIDHLRDADHDDAVMKEVAIGKEAIEDADKMKEVLYKMFLEIGNPSERIEDKSSKLTKEMIEFSNQLIKENMTGSLNILKDQCPSIAANKESMGYLEELIASKGLVDSLGVKEAIARTAVHQISNKVTEATLLVASAFADHLTNLMQDNLNRSKIKLNFLSMEYKEKQSKKQEECPPSSPVDDKDASLLAAQKAKNRISTLERHSKMLHDEGAKTGQVLKRRPTFNRQKELEGKALVEVEISIDDIDDGPSEAAKSTGDVKTEVVVEPQVEKETKRLSVEAALKDAMEDEPTSVESTVEVVKPTEDVEDRARSISSASSTQGSTGSQSRSGSLSGKIDDSQEQQRSGSISMKVANDTEDQQPRKGSLSLKVRPAKPIVEKKVRPKSSGTIDIDLGSRVDLHLTENGLVHMNKNRAKPAKGRRPPSKAAGLAHLIIDESSGIQIDISSPEEDEDEPQTTPVKRDKTPPKTRPKSLQPMDTSSSDTPPIPHSNSLSLKTKPTSPDPDTKPEIRGKPEPPKKENSIKKRLPMGIPMPGLPGMPGLFKKEKSPSIKRKEDEGDQDADKSHDEVENDKESKKEEDTEPESQPKEEPVPKPKPKYKPPGGVPFLGGAMGIGGQLMAEMKKKQGIKDTKEKPKEPTEPEKTSPKVAPRVPKPSPTGPGKTSPNVASRVPKPSPQESIDPGKVSPKAAPRASKSSGSKKPPPPQKLSKEKRQSLILDAGSKPVLADRPARADSVTSQREEPEEPKIGKDDKTEPVDAADGREEGDKEIIEEGENGSDVVDKLDDKKKSGDEVSSDETKKNDSEKLDEGDKKSDETSNDDRKSGVYESNNNKDGDELIFV